MTYSTKAIDLAKATMCGDADEDAGRRNRIYTGRHPTSRMVTGSLSGTMSPKPAGGHILNALKAMNGMKGVSFRGLFKVKAKKQIVPKNDLESQLVMLE